jgi:Phage tail assembly chaperone proteins, E, or 41 or 14
LSAETVRPLREGFQPEEPPEKIPRAAPPPHMEDPPVQDGGAEPLAEKWPIIVKLIHKKIANQEGELLDRLSFRQPRGGDINRYGNPCRVNQEGDVVIDERKMHYIMAALSGILPPMLEQMDPRDWNSCAYRLRDFFLPDLRAWL